MKIGIRNVRNPKFMCAPLSENPAICANIEFELEPILSVQILSQLYSDYYTNVSQGAWTVSYEARLC